jgi:hypothetical protein
LFQVKGKCQNNLIKPRSGFLGKVILLQTQQKEMRKEQLQSNMI